MICECDVDEETDSSSIDDGVAVGCQGGVGTVDGDESEDNKWWG